MKNCNEEPAFRETPLVWCDFSDIHRFFPDMFDIIWGEKTCMKAVFISRAISKASISENINHKSRNSPLCLLIGRSEPQPCCLSLNLMGNFFPKHKLQGRFICFLCSPCKFNELLSIFFVLLHWSSLKSWSFCVSLQSPAWTLIW